MALYKQLLPGAVCVLPFQETYESILRDALSWEQVLVNVLAELAVRLELFPKTANWVLLVRHGTATRYQHWRSVIAMDQRSFVDWKDEMLTFLSQDTGPLEPLGRTSLGAFASEARPEDIAGIMALQAGEGGMHKRFAVTFMDRICPLPGPANRREWIENPFVLANLLLPFLSIVVNSGHFGTALLKALKRPRDLCLVLDAAFLPSKDGHAACADNTNILCLRVNSTSETITSYRGEDLCAASGWLEYSCDPMPREAMWLMLCGLEANRSCRLWTDNLAGAVTYMAMLDHLWSVFLVKRDGPNKALLPDEWSQPKPEHLKSLYEGRTRAILVASNGESWVDLGTLARCLQAAYKLPGTAVAHAAVVSGLLVKEAGTKEMLHDVCAEKAGIFGHKLRLCVRRDAPTRLGAFFPFWDVVTSSIVPCTGSSTVSASAVRDYVNACHQHFVLNYLLGEVYAPFSKIPHLAPQQGAKDDWAFKSWLVAVRRCKGYDISKLPPIDRTRFLRDLDAHKQDLAARNELVGV